MTALKSKKVLLLGVVATIAAFVTGRGGKRLRSIFCLGREVAESEGSA